jgi:spermidine/putrescine transport system permease protein
VFLFLPLVLVLLFSFHSSPRLSLPFEGFSLRWYDEVFNDPAYRLAIENSVIVASCVAAATFVLGTAAVLGLTRLPHRVRAPLGLMFVLPITLPMLFLGVAFLTFWSTLGVRLSLITVGLAHFVVVFPFFFLFARAAMERLDPALDELADDLGANPRQRFLRVTFPLVWPVLAAASVLSFTFSVDQFVVTYFTIGPESTVPMVIWSRVRYSVDPSVNVLASLLLYVTTLGTLVTMGFLLLRRNLVKAVLRS